MLAQAAIADLLRADSVRWNLLGVVAGLELPDAWIAAGFVRNAVWDKLHGRDPQPLGGDVDVIWYDSQNLEPARDRAIEAQFRALAPGIDWSVKNQARMHLRNGDAPYSGASDAMRHWPETATAIAARRTIGDRCEIAAPLGTDDLLGLVLRPTSGFVADRRAIFENRIREKRWFERWPALQFASH